MVLVFLRDVLGAEWEPEDVVFRNKIPFLVKAKLKGQTIYRLEPFALTPAHGSSDRVYVLWHTVDDDRLDRMVKEARANGESATAVYRSVRVCLEFEASLNLRTGEIVYTHPTPPDPEVI